MKLPEKTELFALRMLDVWCDKENLVDWLIQKLFFTNSFEKSDS